MVECEYRRLRWSIMVCQVLIDTWWNVNIFFYFKIAVDYIVLIDTWWNVNESGTDSNKNLSGFNRYMVECE